MELFGIVALADCVGARVDVTDAILAAYVRDEERRRAVRSWGYRSFHCAADDVMISDLAVDAAERALAQAGMDAAQLDLVVLAIPDLADYLCWDVAAAVQGRLGALGAEATLVNHACGSGVMAFDTVAGRFATHPEYTNALIVAANRVCTNYQNRMDSTTTVLSDGAAAAVLRRGHVRGRWLTTEVITDGRYADMFRMEAGGTAQPYGSPGSAGRLLVANPLERLRDLTGNDARKMLAFARDSTQCMRAAFDRACQRAGVHRDEIARVIHLNDNQQALIDLARALDVRLELLDPEFSLAHGHFGSADQLLALSRLSGATQLDGGEVIALTTLGSGMHWAVTLIRW